MFLGDYIDRGAESRAVVDRVRGFVTGKQTQEKKLALRGATKRMIDFKKMEAASLAQGRLCHSCSAADDSAFRAGTRGSDRSNGEPEVVSILQECSFDCMPPSRGYRRNPGFGQYAMFGIGVDVLRV